MVKTSAVDTAMVYNATEAVTELIVEMAGWTIIFKPFLGCPLNKG